MNSNQIDEILAWVKAELEKGNSAVVIMPGKPPCGFFVVHPPEESETETDTDTE